MKSTHQQPVIHYPSYSTIIQRDPPYPTMLALEGIGLGHESRCKRNSRGMTCEMIAYVKGVDSAEAIDGRLLFKSKDAFLIMMLDHLHGKDWTDVAEEF